MMRPGKKIAFLSFVLLAVTFFSCSFRGYGTFSVRNQIEKGLIVTALYIYPEDSSNKGSSVINRPLLYNEKHMEYNIEPGDYVIEADINNGEYSAYEYETAEEDFTSYIQLVGTSVEWFE